MIRAVSVIGTLCLMGCVTAYPPPRQFDMGEFTAPATSPGALTANIIIPEVTQPSWMRTRDIFYRLDYQSPAQPQRYMMNQWVATPGELITLRLRQTVQSANAGFTLSAPNGSTGYLLRTSLQEFTQAFNSPTGSHCIVELRASLWRANGQIAAQRGFRQEIPAPTPDASGAARCLATAVDRDSDEIVQWLREGVAGAP